MNLKEIGEFGFIKKISRGCLIRPDNIVKAIGDDAAAFMTEPDRLTLITTDLLVERIHFLRDAISGFDLGYKSLAVNLSDIAAMGGTAREAFVSIAIPDDCLLIRCQRPGWRYHPFQS
jgi:thiamine-monophosphate kinase